MASQDSHLSYAQQTRNDSENIVSNDSPKSQYPMNNSQVHPQMLHIPQANQYVQLEQMQNQFAPINLQLHRTLPLNPMSTQFSSQVPQQFGSRFSFQGLMNASNFPLGNQTVDSSKGPKKKGKNSKKFETAESSTLRRNWTIEEDVALTRAWLYISVDADVGADQSSGTLWSRILQVWRNNMDVYDVARKTNALACRWGLIQTVVNKFHGYYEQLERQPPSGSTPEDLKNKALLMYKEMEARIFKYEHCWEIMKNNPKWCTRQLTKSGTSKKQKLVDDSSIDNLFPPTQTTMESSLPHGDDVINLDTEITEDGVTRPDGRKATKEKKKRVVTEKGVIDALRHLQCTLERQLDFNREELELKKERDKREYELREQTIKKELEFKERNQKLKEKAQKRKEQERILNKDLTNLQPAVRETFERMQAQILKEWEKDDILGEVPGCEDVDM
ncbi:hypothetical protein OROGR_030995 [Orobanche gracilis]